MIGIQDPSYNLSDLTHTMPLMQPELPTIAKIYVMTSHFQDFAELFTLSRMPFHTFFFFKTKPMCSTRTRSNSTSSAKLS